MRTLNKSVLILLIAAVAACGQHLVEFGNPSIPSVISTDPLDTSTSIGVSRTVNATFSEPMDPATITATTFTVRQGSTSISGSVRYAGLTATFQSSADLAPGTQFTANVSTGAKSMQSSTGLAADYTWTFTTGIANPAATPPAVSSTDPGNNSTGVVTNKQVRAIFSKAMDASTINGTTFTLKQGATPVAGAVSYAGTTATFVPTSLLAASTTYDATISTGARDPGGLAIGATYTWSFVTAGPPVPPAVTSTDPGNNSTGVASNKQITATFSRAMDPTTITAATFLFKQGTTTIPGAVSYAGTTATFAPSSLLADDTVYSATITIGAKDGSGLGMASSYNWSFATGSGPRVLSTDPVDLATNVSLNKTQISAVFNKPMDPATITANTFTLREGLNPITANSISYAGQTATFVLAPGALQSNKTYSVTITAGAKDTGGRAIVADFPWSFSTAAAAGPPLAINLGSAAGFGVASHQAMTSTGVTKINGDVAIYPATACTDSTGTAAGGSQSCMFKVYSTTNGLSVNGSIYFTADPFDNGATASKVTNDLNAAWVEGMNKVDTKGAVPNDELDSPTPYGPGVYHNLAALGLKVGGTATLDGGGDANAVFIFKVGSSLTDSGTLGNPSKIVLINGAQAKNVWFVVQAALTIGHGTTWNGNILAGGDCTVLDGSTVTGRVLGGAAGAGAIVLTGAATNVTTINVPR